MVKQTIRRLRDKAASGLADRVADRLDERMTNGIAERLEGRLADRLADRLVEGLPARLEEPLAEALAGRLEGRLTDRLAEALPGRLEGRLAEALADRLEERLARSLEGPLADGIAARMEAPLAGAVAARLEGPLADGIAGRLAPLLGDRSPAPAEGWTLHLDYAPSASLSPRWCKEGPRNGALVSLFEASRPSWSLLLDRIVEVASDLAGVAESLPEEDPAPRWRNPMLAGPDALSLCAVLSTGPSTYLEIGSGNSTKFVRRFLSSRGLATRVLSIDPAPRAECDALCDEIQRTPFELADLSAFGRLVPGDVVFLDGSHRCFTNSDVTVFFLEVLPRLPAGVIVGVHDVFLPDDYPREWTDRHYSEQYVLAAWLLGAGARAKILFPAYHVCVDAGDDPRLAAARSASGCPADAFHGCAFWFEVPG